MGALFDPSEQLREGVWAYFLLSIWQSSQGSYSTRKSAIWLVWLYYFLPLGMELRRVLTCFVSMEVLPYKYPSFVNFSMIFPCELWIFHFFFQSLWPLRCRTHNRERFQIKCVLKRSTVREQYLAQEHNA